MTEQINDSELIAHNLCVPWSTSKIKTASQCRRQFYNVYVKKMKEESQALSSGTLAHQVIAELLNKRDYVKEEEADQVLQTLIPEDIPEIFKETAYNDVREMLPYMCSFVNSLQDELQEHPGIEKYHVEQRYAVTEDMGRSCFNDKSAFLRGIIDLWYYDKETRVLYIIDHKTDKSAKSVNAVRKTDQLLLYAAFLTLVYNLDWRQCFIGLNFLRKGKKVISPVSREELRTFMKDLLEKLAYLEQIIDSCVVCKEWPAFHGFYCSWCGFRDICNSTEQVNVAAQDATQV